MNDKCWWCGDDALCVSGNVDALVCGRCLDHVNGGTDAGILMAMYRVMEGAGVEIEPEFSVRVKSIVDRVIENGGNVG